MLTMLDILMDLTLYAVFTAIAAYTYSAGLTEQGMILNWWYNWLYKKLMYTKAEWLFNPLVGCPKCVAGQWALWAYLLFHGTMSYQYSFIGHVYYVLASIFFSAIITITVTRIKHV